MEIEWTCSMCELQIEEHNYDTDERMCYECLHDESLMLPTTDDAITVRKRVLQNNMNDFIQYRDTGDENDF
jgi:hypothetical protein